MTQGGGPYRSPGVPGGSSGSGITGPTGMTVGGGGGAWSPSGATGPRGATGIRGPTGPMGVTGSAGPSIPTEVIGSREIPFMLGFRLVYTKYGTTFSISLSFMDSQNFFPVHQYDGTLIPAYVESTIPEALQGVLTPTQALCYSTCIAYYMAIMGGTAQRVQELVPDLYQKTRDHSLWDEIFQEAPKIFEVGQVMMT